MGIQLQSEVTFSAAGFGYILAGVAAWRARNTAFETRGLGLKGSP